MALTISAPPQILLHGIDMLSATITVRERHAGGESLSCSDLQRGVVHIRMMSLESQGEGLFISNMVFVYLCQGTGGVKSVEGNLPVVCVVPNCIYRPWQALQQHNVLGHRQDMSNRVHGIICLPQVPWLLVHAQQWCGIKEIVSHRAFLYCTHAN